MYDNYIVTVIHCMAIYDISVMRWQIVIQRHPLESEVESDFKLSI